MKRNKFYTKREPDKEGKLYFIFCEGEKRETTYFHFFNRLASQIIIQIVPIEDGKNSPMGLYNNAYKTLIESTDYKSYNPAIDEVWFIIDTDKWGQEVNTLRNKIVAHNNWFVAQSNPCFEVWLYYHFEEHKPKEIILNWKEFVNKTINGGFNSNKHPVYIQTAIINSEINFSITNNQLDQITTEVYILAKKILPLVKNDIDSLLSN